MTEQILFRYLLISWVAIAVLVFFLLLFITAPYGRYIRKGWGPEISNRIGWLLMETPSLIVFSSCFYFGNNKSSFPAIVFFCFWTFHYFYRSFIYSFTLLG